MGVRQGPARATPVTACSTRSRSSGARCTAGRPPATGRPTRCTRGSSRTASSRTPSGRPTSRTRRTTRRARGSSTTRWARCGCRRRRCTARRPSAPSTTSRSAASAVPLELVHALAPGQGGRRGHQRAARRAASRTSRRRRAPRRARWRGGAHDDQFPVDVFQTGSGTSTNMNVNEVLATLAAAQRWADPVHPNDDVNASQSSNDDFPSAVHVAALDSATHARCCPALDHLAATFERQGDRARRRREGRPHPPHGRRPGDGRPGAARLRRRRCAAASSGSRSALPRVAELPLGGTAVGTGLNTPPGWRAGGRRRAGRGHRPAGHPGAGRPRGAVRARRARRAVRSAARGRGRA